MATYKDKSDEFLSRMADALDTIKEVSIQRFEFETQRTFTKPNKGGKHDVKKSKGKA